MTTMLYNKVGRRYVPFGREWKGFPANGVWLVEDGRQALIMKVGDLPDPMPLAAIERHRQFAADTMREAYDKLIRKTVIKLDDGTLSVVFPPLNDMIDAFFRAVALAENDRRAGAVGQNVHKS
jgi:hypothetical protein